MRMCCAALCFIWMIQTTSFAESAATDAFKGKSVEEWIARLGSEVFSEREEASAALVASGETAVPALTKALESGDNEIRIRAKLALCALVAISMEGDFVRVASESFIRGGIPTTQSNEAGASSLHIQKGRVIFKQAYGSGIEQVYLFDENTPLVFRNKCSIELNWESISDASNYFPDSRDPKLECVSTEQGLRIMLSATDTRGTSFKMTYVPKAEIEQARSKGARQ